MLNLISKKREMSWVKLCFELSISIGFFFYPVFNFRLQVAGSLQRIDSRLIAEIYNTVGTVRSVDEIRRCLDRRLKTTRSHMVEALRKLRYSKIDQKCLSKKIEQWKSENSSNRIYFQPTGTAESNSGLYKSKFFSKLELGNCFNFRV